jgi:hypothetical protein
MTVMAHAGLMVSADTVLLEFASGVLQRFFVLLSRAGDVSSIVHAHGHERVAAPVREGDGE